MARADLPGSGRKGPSGPLREKRTGFSLSRRLALPSQPALTPLPVIFTLPSFFTGSPGCFPMLTQQRLFFLLVACGVCSAAVSADDLADRFPLSVRVTASHTYLRAGPSNDFYPTERLLHGDTLEVWAVDPAGYCAVRPVSGSFSWLRAADVDDEAVLDGQTDNDHVSESASDPRQSFVGVVVTDGAVSRVGSQLNDLRHVAQVRLEAGERVRVLHTVRISEGRHAGLWAQIEPPAGEYRWVRATDIALPPDLVPPRPENLSAEAETASAAANARAALRDVGDALAEVIQTAGEQPDEPTLGGAAIVDPPAPQPLGPLPMAKRLFSGWLPLGTSVLDPTAPASPVAVSGAVASSGDELTDLDLALSLAVSGPSESWNLAPLRERLRTAAQRTTTQDERLRAEAMDARLARFESIQVRQRALIAGAGGDTSPLRLGGMWSSLSEIGSRPIRPGVFPGGVPADGQPTWTPPEQMETTGRLATVVSRRPDAPRWAIVDGNNNVVAFVTPSPGVNLAPLVGQQVSVRGAKGYMPEYKRPYMVATEARPRLASAPTSSTDSIR
jgi:hypothetical protein